MYRSKPLFHLALYALVLAMLAIPVSAQEQSVRPGINRYYQNPHWEQWVYTFERPGREIYDRRYAIVDAIDLIPGMVVADVGAGTGLFTRLFSPKVAPGGKIYAIDISSTFVKNILRTCREQGLANVAGIVSTQQDVGLPAASIDLAFLSDTYHHFEYPVSMLTSIHRALRSGGKLIIIDFHRNPRFSSPWVMQHVRAGQDTVVREIQAAGFRFAEEKPLLRTNYFLVFGKADQ